MKKGLILGLALSLLVFNVALAIDLPGVNVDVNSSSNVNLGLPGGQGIDVNQNSAGSTVNTPGRSTELTPNSVNTNVGGSLDINASKNAATGAANVDINAGGLELQVNQGLLDNASKQAIISLQGGTDVLIQTNNDLETYKSLVINECQSIKTISTSGNTVMVEYKQPAKFLGIFGGSLNGTIEVDASGNTNIKLPWYSFLFKKNTGQIETAIESGISSGNVLQVNSNGSSVTVQQQARTISVVTSAVAVNVSPCGTTVENNNSQTPDPTPAPAQTPAPSPQPTPAPASSSGVAVFAGTYNGTFTKSPLVSAECVASGTTKFVVNSNGNVTVTTTGAGVTISGSGKVDANGNFTGSWSYAGQTSNYSGKFSGNSGSGSYSNNFGCSGSWSVNK